MRPLTDVDIARVFNTTFAADEVVMRGGFGEPLYLPRGNSACSAGACVAEVPAEIRYARDHAASALHEAAHWCIAGNRRRALIDFGYFYEPPPRGLAGRARFADGEVLPQALERIFAQACGVAFRPSADDFDAAAAWMVEFASRIEARAARLQETGLPVRARRFLSALSARTDG